MKELLVGFAEYNMKASAKMLSILEAAPPAALTKETGSFYKTVFATVGHLCVAELNWLKRFNEFFPCAALSGSALIATSIEELRDRSKVDPPTLFALLREADRLFVAFANELRPADLDTRFKFKNAKGEEMERKYWNAIFHILNHGTHHRGEISAMLDMQGISNDYSGFNLYTK
jgi:uncharacterized damage-inducible protein DinB